MKKFLPLCVAGLSLTVASAMAQYYQTHIRLGEPIGISATNQALTSDSRENITANESDETGTRTDRRQGEYAFYHKKTAVSIEPYVTTVYISTPQEVHTLRGETLMATKDTIADFAVNPAGTSFVVVTHPRKGLAKLEQFRTGSVSKKMSSFDSKHLGEPLAGAFTSDGRRLVVSTESGAKIFDARKMTPLGGFDWAIVAPRNMTISPNDYFLVGTDGRAVGIYNLQDGKLRKHLNLEAEVTDVLFSPDNKQLAILTDDGLLMLLDTRNFDVTNMVDDLGDGVAFDFNQDGKYVAVVTDEGNVEVVNLLKTSDRRKFKVEQRGVHDVAMIKDSSEKPLLAFGEEGAIHVFRLEGLEPYFAKLVSDEVDMKMAEWTKMQPGESMEAYRERVTEETRARQRRLFEDEISTRLAGESMTMSAMSLGNYNRDQEVLAIQFADMPTIYLPVSSTDIQSFHDADDLEMKEVQYGLLPDDSFEVIYAVFRNKRDGKEYVYDNVDRVPMTFMADDNVVSLELLQLQQMEELRLQEIKDQVVAEARHDNVITDNTSITVDSNVQPDYDANGEKILNYTVKFSYDVAPGFSATEDFGPGRYHVEESGAAKSMLAIVKQAFEGDFAQYLKPGAKLLVNLYGTADATPIVHGIPYDGSYGEFDEEPIRQDGALTGISVTRKDGITTNEQLAFLRAVGVKDYLQSQIPDLGKMDSDYRYNISVSPDKGSEHRRITAEFTFVDAF